MGIGSTKSAGIGPTTAFGKTAGDPKDINVTGAETPTPQSGGIGQTPQVKPQPQLPPTAGRILDTQG